MNLDDELLNGETAEYLHRCSRKKETSSLNQQLLAAGNIRRSESPWTSNVVLCRKTKGELRICVDYRQLNSRTIKDADALPLHRYMTMPKQTFKKTVNQNKKLVGQGGLRPNQSG